MCDSKEYNNIVKTKTCNIPLLPTIKAQVQQIHKILQLVQHDPNTRNKEGVDNQC